ncbi:MAG: hypothetical protein V4583_08965 [Pseudomonadota bacterium]
MTAIGIQFPGYRQAHDEVDSRLYDAQGLTLALEQMMMLHPALGKADDEQSQAMFALVRAVDETIRTARSFQEAAWDALRQPPVTQEAA